MSTIALDAYDSLMTKLTQAKAVSCLIRAAGANASDDAITYGDLLDEVEQRVDIVYKQVEDQRKATKAVRHGS